MYIYRPAEFEVDWPSIGGAVADSMRKLVHSLSILALWKPDFQSLRLDQYCFKSGQTTFYGLIDTGRGHGRLLTRFECRVGWQCPVKVR